MKKFFLKNNYKKNDKIYIVGFFQSEKYIQNTEFYKIFKKYIIPQMLKIQIN